ncbi:hypothetical protein ON010_g4203 [Phytophthora cinnamomi]|nr:hypothetical protein ON010_g4203 [Phytophthora cinnamomi]
MVRHGERHVRHGPQDAVDDELDTRDLEAGRDDVHALDAQVPQRRDELDDVVNHRPKRLPTHRGAVHHDVVRRDARLHQLVADGLGLHEALPLVLASRRHEVAEGVGLVLRVGLHGVPVELGGPGDARGAQRREVPAPVERVAQDEDHLAVRRGVEGHGVGVLRDALEVGRHRRVARRVALRVHAVQHEALAEEVEPRGGQQRQAVAAAAVARLGLAATEPRAAQLLLAAAHRVQWQHRALHARAGDVHGHIGRPRAAESGRHGGRERQIRSRRGELEETRRMVAWGDLEATHTDGAIDTMTDFDALDQVDPFYMALLRSRQRRFADCIDICTDILAQNPYDQAAWVTKTKAMTMQNFIDDSELEEDGAADLLTSVLKVILRSQYQRDLDREEERARRDEERQRRREEDEQRRQEEERRRDEEREERRRRSEERAEERAENRRRHEQFMQMMMMLVGKNGASEQRDTDC